VASDLEERFARLIEHHVRHGALPRPEDLAPDRPDLAAQLLALAQEYLKLSAQLDTGVTGAGAAPPLPSGAEGPVLEGFRTIERLGAGGMGEVYKLEDLQLKRFVAAKVIRAEGPIRTAVAEFLHEARTLALFSDRRIVQIFEFRADAQPPVIVMEYVEGFELGRLAPSLEFRQRARIMRDICDALEHAHRLGLQHRDLKPSNVMLDAALSPKILDFGLSGADPSRGHFRGTLHYFAPEQLDSTQPIDARTDVYALGVMLYELICGAVPFTGADQAAVLDAIRREPARLPAEVDPRVPEPLQAIALKAMERRPADRYQSAREMALDLGRYLEDRPVLGRPTNYASTLDLRIRPHLAQIEEWLRLKLIYPHEADRLRAAYRQFDAREDDWIAASRTLSYSQIALYFGAFLLFAGSLFYFSAHRFFHAIVGVIRPFVVLGLPFIGLNLAGRHLYRTERKAVAIAFFLAGVSLLPLFLLIALHESHLWLAPPGAAGQLFDDGSISNRQLQITIAIASVWAGWLALRTTTAAMSTVFTILVFLLTLAVLGDFGLRSWLENGAWDRLAVHLSPLALAYGALAFALERTARPWFARPLYVAAAVVLVATLDLLALNGRTLHYLDVSLQRFQSPKDSVSIDTLCALTLNGVTFYLLASSIERWSRGLMTIAAGWLFVIAPFSTLEPLAYLVESSAYSAKINWIYLAVAVTTAVVSHHRQRKSFYYAGLVNTGVALYLIADRYHWMDRPTWAIALVVIGLAILGGGFYLDARERRRFHGAP